MSNDCIPYHKNEGSNSSLDSSYLITFHGLQLGQSALASLLNGILLVILLRRITHMWDRIYDSFIVNIAVVDLLTGLQSLFNSIVFFAHPEGSHHSHAIQTTRYVTFKIVHYSSVALFVSFSLLQYIALRCQYHYIKHNWNPKAIITWSWFLSIIVAGARTVSHETTQCYSTYSKIKLCEVVGTALSSFMIVVCHATILATFIRQSRQKSISTAPTPKQSTRKSKRVRNGMPPPKSAPATPSDTPANFQSPFTRSKSSCNLQPEQAPRPTQKVYLLSLSQLNIHSSRVHSNESLSIVKSSTVGPCPSCESFNIHTQHTPAEDIKKSKGSQKSERKTDARSSTRLQVHRTRSRRKRATITVTSMVLVSTLYVVSTIPYILLYIGAILSDKGIFSDNPMRQLERNYINGILIPLRAAIDPILNCMKHPASRAVLLRFRGSLVGWFNRLLHRTRAEH